MRKTNNGTVVLWQSNSIFDTIP